MVPFLIFGKIDIANKQFLMFVLIQFLFNY